MGELFAKGTSRPATVQELALYEQLRHWQSQQPVSVLQHVDNTHEYLFFALFDGTGQDVNNPEQLPTNIGHLSLQAELLERNLSHRIGTYYAEGIGTQENPVTRYWDAAFPYTWDDKIERAYMGLSDQARKWKQQKPQAEIHVVEVGYSRGAVLAAGFARLVDRYGIAHPDELKFGRDAHGNITVESPRPPIVPPGEVAQAVWLFDPVATNMPRNYDARLPPSVISGFSVIAANEQREAYPHQTMLDLQMTPDGRFASAPIAGGHSNAGGGNAEDGLETLAFNGMVDYLNALRDRPAFEYRPLPADPAMYTVYQARGPTAVPGLDRDGVRNLRDELANCKIVDPCRDAEPVNRELAQRFEYRLLQPSAPRPAFPSMHDDIWVAPAPMELRRDVLPPSDPSHPDHAMLEQIRAGVRAIDQRAGKDYDETSERLSRGLLVASKDIRESYPDRSNVPLAANALNRIDHVVMGSDGKHLFAVEGGLQDLAHKRAAVVVEQAMRTPVEQSDVKLEAANRMIGDEVSLQRQQTSTRGMEDPARSAPALSH